MDEIIDFSNLPTLKKTYSGANGSKLCILYNNELYMLKFPSKSKRNTNINYTNGTISEYLGCHILSSLGIETQETKLGIYKTNGKEKIVVACKDFTENKLVFQDFASIKNTIVDSGHNGTGTELSEVLETIKDQQFFNPKELNGYFWDLFIGDALIGNWDRHNGNWGTLYNPSTDEIKLAPVFDCGSCLYPSIDHSFIDLIFSDKKELLFRIYEIPTSALKLDGQKIKYFDFIDSLSNPDCNEALKRIYPKINLEKINSIIDNTPFIDDKFKTFYKTILKSRKELILEKAYNKLIEREKNIEKNDVFIQSPVDLCNKYMEVLLESAKTLSLKESMKKAYETVIETSDKVTTSLNKHMFKSYFNNMGIKTGKDFEDYFQSKINEAKEKELVQKIKPSKKIDDDFGYGY